jgi:TRAP-type uncharacterized transport system fused permease subunit
MSASNSTELNQTSATPITKKLEVDVTRLQKLPLWQSSIFFVLSFLGVLLGIFYIFGFTLMQEVLLQVQYYWLFIGLFSACIFIAMPARKSDKAKLPWYDMIIALVVLGICFYFTYNAEDMQM